MTASVSRVSDNTFSVLTQYWVCAYPFFDSTIFVVPQFALPAGSDFAATSENDSPNISRLSVYDADGALANELLLESPKNKIGILELESLMGGCKLESGMKHGQLLVESPAGFTHFCRLHSREGAALLGRPTPLTASLSNFFPLTIDDGRSYFLAMINQSRIPASVKVRLFCAKRSPETIVSIPALGSRVLNLETEFPDYRAVAANKQIQAYLRMSTKTDAVVGLQLIERHATKSEGGIFNAVG